ncbi:hypothetical protein CL614_01230 [archaeon]|nr:hypothetical protein [archaeon]|tara:strand:+ start:1125 stop:1661 length:537 start_codon:yes stop_codon:yes gene_type:complete
MAEEKIVKKKESVKPKIAKSKKAEKKVEKKQEVAADKIYTIPLKKALMRSMRKRSNAAMKLVKSYVLLHTKADEVKIGKNLAHFMLEKSHHIPRKVRVNVFLVTEEEKKIANTELLGNSYNETKAVEKKASGGGIAEKLKSRLGAKALQKQEEEEKIEGKTKGKKIEKPKKIEVPKQE